VAGSLEPPATPPLDGCSPDPPPPAPPLAVVAFAFSSAFAALVRSVALTSGVEEATGALGVAPPFERAVVVPVGLPLFVDVGESVSFAPEDSLASVQEIAIATENTSDQRATDHDI
jgi:hypothetical protein